MLLVALEQLDRKCNQIRAQLYAACIDGDVHSIEGLLLEIPVQRRLKILNGDHPEEKSALYMYFLRFFFKKYA